MKQTNIGPQNWDDYNSQTSRYEDGDIIHVLPDKFRKQKPTTVSRFFYMMALFAFVVSFYVGQQTNLDSLSRTVRDKSSEARPRVGDYCDQNFVKNRCSQDNTILQCTNKNVLVDKKLKIPSGQKCQEVKVPQLDVLLIED
ncbi:hypothetical protein HK096_010296 [Nowakowskiella sp. JEL0078]|nr:hypothetical protein HK096_010296 [Nowakowskiella sp. JEL0078]